MKCEAGEGLVESLISRYILNPSLTWSLRNSMPVERMQQSTLGSTVLDVQPPASLVAGHAVATVARARLSVPDPPEPDNDYPCADGIPFAPSPEQGKAMMELRQTLGNYFERQRAVYIGMDMLVLDKRGGPGLASHFQGDE